MRLPIEANTHYQILDERGALVSQPRVIIDGHDLQVYLDGAAATPNLILQNYALYSPITDGWALLDLNTTFATGLADQQALIALAEESAAATNMAASQVTHSSAKIAAAAIGVLGIGAALAGNNHHAEKPENKTPPKPNPDTPSQPNPDTPSQPNPDVPPDNKKPTPIPQPSELKITGDNHINVTEAKQEITISGQIKGAKNGESVRLTLDDENIAIVKVDEQGNFTHAMEGSALAALGKGEITAVLVSDSNVSVKQNFTVANDVQAQIAITAIGQQGTIGFHHGEDKVRIKGTLDLSNTEHYKIGGNVSMVKSITLKIGNKAYEAGINEENQTFFVDVAKEDLIAADGKAISYSIEADPAYDIVDAEGILLNGKPVTIIGTVDEQLTAENTRITLKSDFLSLKDNAYHVNSAALNDDLDTFISGKISGVAVKAQDAIVVTVGGKTYQTVVNDDFTFSVRVRTADLEHSGAESVTAQLTAHNAAGDKISVSDETIYSVAEAGNGEMVHYDEKVNSYDDLPYFLQVLNIEHYNETYGYDFAIGERLQQYEYGTRPEERDVIKFHFATPDEALQNYENIYGHEVLSNFINYSTEGKQIIRDTLKTLENYVDLQFEEVDSIADTHFFLLPI